jgi:hypothetical protein
MEDDGSARDIETWLSGRFHIFAVFQVISNILQRQSLYGMAPEKCRIHFFEVCSSEPTVKPPPKPDESPR